MRRTRVLTAVVLATAVALTLPARAEDLMGEARALEDHQQWSQAAAVYEKLLDDDPTNADAHYRLGTLREKVGMFDSALREYREALRLVPDHAGARQAIEGYYVAIGMTARAGGRSDAAIEAFKQALTFDPASVTARLELGRELEQRGRKSEALAVYEDGVRLRPDEAGMQARLGALYLEQGRHADAAKAYENAVRLVPSDADAQRGLGLAYAGLGERDKAFAAYEQAIRHYLLAGQEDKAIEVERLERDVQRTKNPSR